MEDYECRYYDTKKKTKEEKTAKLRSLKSSANEKVEAVFYIILLSVHIKLNCSGVKESMVSQWYK